MNSGLRRIGAHVLHAAGYYTARRRIDARRGNRLLVLMYHDIIDDDARGRILDHDSPTASEFARHIELATSKFRVVSLSDAVREMRAGGLCEDSVAITFDDGYASVHRNALPVLQRHTAPSTLFVLTGWIDGRTFWWFRIRAIIAQAPLHSVDVDGIGRVLGGRLVGLNGGVASGGQFRVSLARQAEDLLRDMEDTDRDATIDRLRDLLLEGAAETQSAAPSLRWNQIEEMAAHGMEFGAHTVSHVNFRYADARTIGQEIAISRDEVARHTGAPVAGFAFPYGKDLGHYRAYEDLLQTHGFEYACTAVPGNNRSVQSTFSLRRVTPPPTRSDALIDHALCQSFVRDNSFYDMRAGG